MRIRIVGGELDAATLAGLAAVAATFGDGEIHLTARANLQLRAVEHGEAFLAAVEQLGLLPSRAHDQARNIMVSPLSGRRGGRLDARPVAAELDTLLRSDPRAADLPGRFLFVLDDGRGDLVTRRTDLGFTALDADVVQLRVGAQSYDVVPADRAAVALVELARRFLEARGDGPDAPWHVDELAAPLVHARPADPRTPAASDADSAAGPELGPAHLAVPDGVLTPALVAAATRHGGPLVVTPWNSIIVTELLP